MLKPDGFEYLHFASLTEFEQWQRGRGRDQRFHIEIALGTHAERSILWASLERGATVDITLHDPPFIAYPYYRSGSRWVNQALKLAQLRLPQKFFGLTKARRIRRIFVLSHAGCARTLAAYPGVTVRHLPHICVRQPLAGAQELQCLVYTGFIGKKKGLDYALQIHRALLTEFPGLVFKVVGEPVDSITRAYFETLQQRYRDNVEYLGYVDDEVFARLLSAGHVVMLPTRDYGTICPVSGNILKALTLGSLVISTAGKCQRRAHRRRRQWPYAAQCTGRRHCDGRKPATRPSHAILHHQRGTKPHSTRQQSAAGARSAGSMNSRPHGDALRSKLIALNVFLLFLYSPNFISVVYPALKGLQLAVFLVTAGYLLMTAAQRIDRLTAHLLLFLVFLVCSATVNYVRFTNTESLYLTLSYVVKALNVVMLFQLCHTPIDLDRMLKLCAVVMVVYALHGIVQFIVVALGLLAPQGGDRVAGLRIRQYGLGRDLPSCVSDR